MLCPKCKKEMIVVERDRLELDWCPFCKGFWFDHREWEILCQKLYMTRDVAPVDIYSVPKINVNEETRICPICNEKTEKFQIYGVTLDRCKNKHGIWFDKGEISELLNKSQRKTQGENSINFMGEIFFK